MPHMQGMSASNYFMQHGEEGSHYQEKLDSAERGRARRKKQFNRIKDKVKCGYPGCKVKPETDGYEITNFVQIDMNLRCEKHGLYEEHSVWLCEKHDKELDSDKKVVDTIPKESWMLAEDFQKIFGS